jgi:hypothetical protein
MLQEHTDKYRVNIALVCSVLAAHDAVSLDDRVLQPHRLVKHYCNHDHRRNPAAIGKQRDLGGLVIIT